MQLKLVKRTASTPVQTLLITLVAILLALAVCALFLLLSGFDPLKIYGMMAKSAFGSLYGLEESLVKAIPLMLCGLGVSLAFRMQLWNIGAEGQLYMGALGATWVALTYPGLSAWVMIPTMFMASFLAGGLWGLLPAIPRAYLNVNETITTLLLNYVAILWADYLVYGPWRDPDGYNFPLTAAFSPAAMLPTLGSSRIHLGLVFALVAAVVVYVAIRYTKWGYQVRVIGESPAAARYAGMNIPRQICLAMFLSGSLAGLAGMSEVAGVAGRLQHGLSPGYGYTAIIVAWLARLHPALLVLVSFLFGGLLVGGYASQLVGLPAATVNMIQGAILFFVLGAQIFTAYDLKVVRRKAAQPPKEAA